jgi:hypothetical protein
MGMRTNEQPMRHHSLLLREFRWHKYGTPEVRLDSCKVGPFIQSYHVPLTNVRYLPGLSVSTLSMLVASMLKETPASRRFVGYTACHVAMRDSVARTICSYGSSHESRVHSLGPSIVKTASRRCITKGCVSKSLNRLLLIWNRV